MLQPLLVQPPSGGRISGGFRYNARMAEHGLWALADVAHGDLDRFLRGLPRERPVLMDSIWLTTEGFPPFRQHVGRGSHVGLMLHSLPSMIDATERGLAPPARPSRFEEETLAALELVLVPGRHYRDLLADLPCRIVVAEPGIDDGWRAEPRRRNGACRLVSVGAVTPRKGFLDVVEAIDGHAEGELIWTAVGSLDADREYSSRLLARIGQRSSMLLAGQRPPDEAREIVQASDLFLMPSYDENQPLVLLEAMAASVPCVAYAAGATPHMMEHGREGLIAPVGDRATFASHVHRLLADEPLRYEMAHHCWQRQRSFPQWRDAAARARGELERIFA
jgi:glycosyltransferase involved in cell wall biosynthesis